MSDVHTPAFWAQMQAHHHETKAMHAAFAAYHEATDKAHQWAMTELASGRTLAEVIPTLRIKYYRANRALTAGIHNGRR